MAAQSVTGGSPGFRLLLSSAPVPAAPPGVAATIQQANSAEAGGDPYACVLRARALELIPPAADPAVLAELEQARQP